MNSDRVRAFFRTVILGALSFILLAGAGLVVVGAIFILWPTGKTQDQAVNRQAQAKAVAADAVAEKISMEVPRYLAGRTLAFLPLVSTKCASEESRQLVTGSEFRKFSSYDGGSETFSVVVAASWSPSGSGISSVGYSQGCRFTRNLLVLENEGGRQKWLFPGNSQIIVGGHAICLSGDKPQVTETGEPACKAIDGRAPDLVLFLRYVELKPAEGDKPNNELPPFTQADLRYALVSPFDNRHHTILSGDHNVIDHFGGKAGLTVFYEKGGEAFQEIYSLTDFREARKVRLLRVGE